MYNRIEVLYKKFNRYWRDNMKLSFTTLSCPDWSWEHIVSEAVRLGYDGIEIRGIEGEMYLPKAKPFLPENLEATLNLLKKQNLEICCLDTSCRFHDSATFDNFIEEGKASIDLAEKLNAPYIRVFGDAIPNLEKKEETISKVAKGLDALGQFAENKAVYVLIETHGDFSSSKDLLQVLEKTTTKSIGVLWDVNHPYKAFDESFDITYNRLGKYIKHVHLKDSIGSGKNARLCMVGEGDLPVLDAINFLKAKKYDGYLSLEWEKKWHPELPEPEIAIDSYIKYLRPHL